MKRAKDFLISFIEKKHDNSPKPTERKVSFDIKPEIYSSEEVDKQMKTDVFQPPKKTKWMPNKKLQKEFDEKSKEVALIKSKKKKLEHLIYEKERIMKQYDTNMKSDEIEDKLEAMNLKNDIIEKQFAVENLEYEIKEAKNVGEDIITKWSEYVELATDFIQKNHLIGIVSPKDILNDNGIYLKAKVYMDECLTSVSKDRAKHKLALMDAYFDLSLAYNNSKGLFRKEFKQFSDDFSENSVDYLLYDKLDDNVGENMKKPQHGRDVNKINYKLTDNYKKNDKLLLESSELDVIEDEE